MLDPAATLRCGRSESLQFRSNLSIAVSGRTDPTCNSIIDITGKQAMVTCRSRERKAEEEEEEMPEVERP